MADRVNKVVVVGDIFNILGTQWEVPDGKVVHAPTIGHPGYDVALRGAAAAQLPRGERGAHRLQLVRARDP